MRSDLGLYEPGTSWLHRTPAGVKLAGLVVLGAASVILQRYGVAVAGLVAVVVGAYLSAGLGLRCLARQVRPVWVLLAFTAAAQLLARLWHNAWSVPLTLACLVALAALVTLTTRTSALVDVVVALVGPLRRLGVRPERVGLAVMLGLRCVPLLAGLVATVREAQIARSGSFHLAAFGTPLVIGALRRADALGEALVARGIDD